ncbi:MAG: hypothetical protein AAB944_02780 [Patescibacteria group bacterium]
MTDLLIQRSSDSDESSDSEEIIRHSSRRDISSFDCEVFRTEQPEGFDELDELRV